MTLDQDFPPTVLITRPEPQAGRLAQSLSAQGVRTVVSPLMRVGYPAVELPEGAFAAVILTSEAGALAARRLRGQVPDLAYCVGKRTADQARAGGFTVKATAATAEDLLAHLTDAPGPLLYLRGREVSSDLAAVLAARGQEASSVVIYAQNAAPLSGEAVDVLRRQGRVIVPLYSARSARLFVAQVPEDANASLQVCAIAAPVVSALPAAWQSRATVAAHPDGHAMMAAILRAIQTFLP
jgi:uroporphyrinogen-III synthase